MMTKVDLASCPYSATSIRRRCSQRQEKDSSAVSSLIILGGELPGLDVRQNDDDDNDEDDAEAADHELARLVLDLLGALHVWRAQKGKRELQYVQFT